MIPKTLDAWTLDAIRQIVASAIAENDLFDFKADLQPAENQRKAVAAFANTSGGFMIFGVTDQREILGVENAELPAEFGGKLGISVDPAVDYRFGAPIVLESRRMVFVCHVPQSADGPHSVHLNGATVFFKRTPAGTCVPMTRSEISAAFKRGSGNRTPLQHEGGERPGDLALLRNEVQRIRDRAYEVNCFIWRRDSAQRYRDLATSGFVAVSLDSLLRGVFHRLSADPILVNSLNLVRERSRAIGVASSIVASKVDAGICATEDLERYHSVLREHVPDLVMSADTLLLRLGVLLS